jgi:hypothetical protein
VAKGRRVDQAEVAAARIDARLDHAGRAERGHRNEEGSESEKDEENRGVLHDLSLCCERFELYHLDARLHFHPLEQGGLLTWECSAN